MESNAFNRDAFYQAAWNPLHSIMLQVSTAFNHAALNSLHSIGFHFFMLPGIHCIKSRCMESTAFNWDAFYQAAWNPLHSRMPHRIHCIPSGCFWPCCIKPTAFNHAARYPMHSIGMFSDMLQKIHCSKSGCFWPSFKKSTAFNHAAGIHCIQSCCIKSTEFHRVQFLHAAWNPLHSIMLHGILCIQSGCFGTC